MDRRSPVTAPQHAFVVLLVTTRCALTTFFGTLRQQGLPGLAVRTVSPEVETFEKIRDSLSPVAVVAVDLGTHADAGIGLCRSIRAQAPEMPIVGIFCCSASLNPRHVDALVEWDASALDLEATPEEAARALRAVRHGSSVFNLRLQRRTRASLRDIVEGSKRTARTRLRLLELVALGLPDREIGKRLYLSPHTVKHHIEALRQELGVRNRIELAAWAGMHGFYPAGSRARGVA